MKVTVVSLLLITLAACVSPPVAEPASKGGSLTQPVSVAVHGSGVPLELHWFRNSAERRAIEAEIYAQATRSVQAHAQGLAPNSWAVILDIDETILDNSEYQVRLALTGQPYSPATWAAWVHDRKAVALPGAAAFVQAVRSDFHGRVVLVTNRSLADCPDTETNLHDQGIEYDAILCAPDGPDGKPVSDKNPRFALVKGGALPSLGRLNVIAYVGDNIQDFPGLSQANPGDLSHFGQDFFVLPNPMYGSWVGNVYR
jgi:5'-nucleotidase (lipoprotein e(P4) family)